MNKNYASSKWQLMGSEALPSKWTIQDEQYAQLLFQGMEQSEAFLVIRPHAAKWKPESVWQNASKWAAKVKPRLAELRSKMEKRFEVSQERVLQEYAQTAFKPIEALPEYADKHAALKGIRDMLGYDAPKRTEEFKKSLSLEVQAELKSLTLEELRVLLLETRTEGEGHDALS